MTTHWFRGRLSLVLSLIALAAPGCAREARVYEPVAHHTLKTGPDVEQDVVWVQQYESTSSTTKLLRCHPTPAGPKCDEANTGQ